MTEEVLILKRHPEYDDPESYNVLFEYVGRIFKADACATASDSVVLGP